MPLVSILSTYLTSRKRFFDRILGLFDGYNREWWIRFKDESYTKCFFPESSNDILRLSKYKSLDECEFNFSVQHFNNHNVNSMFDWDFIIDIDKCCLEERKKICKRVMDLLNHFKLVYLVDSRFHIWFPPWIHSCIDNWNSYYNKDFACYMKYFLEVTCDIKGKADIDNALWYVNRHKIRVPYTFHLEDNVLQVFYEFKGNSFHVMPFERVYKIWKGSDLTSEEILEYNERFKNFIDTAIRIGKPLFEGFNFDKLVIDERISIRNKKLRPCFNYLLKNEKEMTHKMRMATVLEAVCSGYTDVSEIARLFKNQKDYSFSKSLYHVMYLLRNTKFIKPYRCDTIQRLGWCLREKCKYYKKRKSN